MPSPSVRHNFAKLTPTPRARLISEYGVNGFFGRVTTARTTDLWLPDADGVYQQYGSGEVGIINGDAVWSQPGATNLATYSEDSAQWGAWSGGVTETANAATAPDGTLTATQLTSIDSAADGAIVSGGNITLAASTEYNFSIHVENVDSGSSQIFAYDQNGPSAIGQVQFNWTAGVPSTASSSGASNIRYERLGSTNIYRISFSATTPGSVTTHIMVLQPDRGNAQKSVYAWGSQITAGSFVTSYIPTAGSAVTINATQPKIVTPNPTTNFAGRFIWRPAAASQGTVWLLGNYTDANNAWGILHDGTNVIFRNRIAGSNNDAVKSLSYSADTDYLIQYRHDTINGLDIAVDGTVGTNDATTTAVTNAANTFLQQDGNQAGHATGSIRDIRSIQHAAGWTDSEWLAS